MTRHNVGEAAKPHSDEDVTPVPRHAEETVDKKPKSSAILFVALKNLLFWGSCCLTIWVLYLLFF